MLSFPLLGFRENRPILSKEELEMRIQEARECNKSCEVTFFSFSVWKNSEPIPEYAILDKVLIKGPKGVLEEFAKEKQEVGIKSYLLFDGKDYILILKEEVKDLENYLNYKVPLGCKVLHPLTKIVIPGEINFKTGKRSKVIKKW